MKNTFKVYCEGDIERFSKALREMIEAGVPQKITVRCPTDAWPFLIMDMIEKDFRDMPNREEEIVDISFAPDQRDTEWENEAKELQDKIMDMSDDELSDFLDDLLSDFDADDDDEDDDTNDKDN